MGEWSWLSEAPSIVLMVVVVIVFVSYLRARDRSNDEAIHRYTSQFVGYMKARDESLAVTLRHMGDDCHSVQRRSIEALDRNSDALLRCKQTMEQSASAATEAATIIAHHAKTIERQAGDADRNRDRPGQT